jgi:hypothetical protein
MTSSHVPAPSHEQFTVPERRRVQPGAIATFIVYFIVFCGGLFLMGAGATWGNGDGNAWVFFAGILAAIAPFFVGMTFHKH